ncbi:MAG: hypothetical protein HS130_01450 [Deltaproteobacteria bacterium]|nr:hypothetical protein [Deltaproteobacteria bacterium]MCL4872838.1 hypothetical protein [bacterium]
MVRAATAENKKMGLGRRPIRKRLYNIGVHGSTVKELALFLALFIDFARSYMILLAMDRNKFL